MTPLFIFMLTHNDRTVEDARHRFASISSCRVDVVGFKDIGLPKSELAQLNHDIQASGRKSALEVVSLDEESEARSARMAVEIGVDFLLGGTRPSIVLPIIAGAAIRYYPFCGVVEDHPSRLVGTLEDIAKDAARLTAMDGVDGVDLLAYRWDGDVAKMARRVVEKCHGPVIAAGSIDRPEKIEALCRAGVAGFTVGTAAFEKKFNSRSDSLAGQIDAISEIAGEVGMSISREMIVEAAERIGDRVRKTPVMLADRLDGAGNAEVTLKLESLQHSGSFKARGAFNSLLSMDIPEAGVVAASGGNHGAAVAFAGMRLGVPAEIFVPDIVSPAKLDRLRRYGANVHVIPGVYADALEACNEHQHRTGALSIHAYDAPTVVAGQGTTGREIAEQIPGVDTIFVAVGGGGLIGGISSWFSGDAHVIGVEPESCRSLAAALEAGHPVDVDVSGLAADALGARKVGDIAFGAAEKFVDRVITLRDEDILAAQRHLWSEYRVAAEPAGAAALAPLLTGAYRPREGEKICVLICGGNTDPAKLAA